MLISFFGTTSPALYLALAYFHRQIIDLARVYQWQEGALPLAIDLHTHIVESYPTNLIDGKYQQMARTILPHIPTPRRGVTLPHCPRKLQEKPRCQRLFMHATAVNRKIMEQGLARKYRSPPSIRFCFLNEKCRVINFSLCFNGRVR